MEFAAQEALEGLRLSWNAWPRARLEASRVPIPLGAVLTPLKAIEGLPVLPYEPVRCKGCPCVLNGFCAPDYQAHLWTCPLCRARNSFPPQYGQVNEALLPAELYPNLLSVEYILHQPVPAPPAFLFVLDTSLCPEELQDLKAEIKHVISLLPEYALVGLISFGTNVEVHELGFHEVPKSYLLHGQRELPASELRGLLGLGPAGLQQAKVPSSPTRAGTPGIGRFLLPLGECEFALESAVDDLLADEVAVSLTERWPRATGAAVGAAVGLLESCVPGSGARIMVFTGGPCTTGPGLVVGPNKADPIRTHKDFLKDDVKLFKSAVKFYDELGGRLTAAGHCLDLFACSLDQVGLAEMHPAVAATGGVMVLAETFGHNLLRQSLARLFQRDEQELLDMAWHGTLDVLTPPEVRLQGATGPLASLHKKQKAAVSDTEVGVGGTSAWRLCALSRQTSVGIFFEVASNAAPAPGGGASHFVLQFSTQYQHPSGQNRLRVVTIARQWAEKDSPALGLSFDQEAAAVLLARQALTRCLQDEASDVLRWVDRALVKLANRFGEYTNDQADTFALPPHLALFPQFIFHLRRSQFLQVFNNTPDETAFFRLMLEREGVTESLLMIQPTLVAFPYEGPPYPVLLDVASLKPDVVLVLDTWFLMVVHYGSTIAAWRREGYQERPEYATFRELLAAPMAEARAMAAHRVPVPRIVETDQGGSQARFLLAKLNPSATHDSSSSLAAPGASEIILTDDVSLSVFQEHLAKLAVQT